VGIRNLLPVFLLLLCIGRPVLAEETQERTLADRAKLFPKSSLFLMDVSGSFRSRVDLWQSVHMGLSPIPNKYGVYPQLSGSSSGAGVREQTDFRFRLSPTLHLAEMADVMAVVDLFHVQAGEGGTSDIAAALQNDFMVLPPGEFGSPLNSAYVRGLWARMKLLHIVTVTVGRIPANWGMGLVENDARALDADGGDFIDGLELSSELPLSFNVATSIDYAVSGRTIENPFAPWGVAHDPGDMDDALQWRIKLSMTPPADGKGSYWSWGFYNRLRWQNFSSLGPENPYEECQLNNWEPTFGCAEMYWRDAFIWTPDLWFDSALAVSDSLRLRLSVELAGRYGTINGTRFVPESSSRVLYGMGGVFKAGLESDRFEALLEVGGASGDKDSLAFGILDKPLLGEPDSATVAGTQNRHITSFALHSNYHVDQILFRRIVGAVTNALYIKPQGRINLAGNDRTRFWMGASAMYAMAFVPDSTPGEASPLGVEANLQFGLDFGSHVKSRIDGAMLIPLAGLANNSRLENPLPWTARFLLDFSF
jgi:uncharacterized protein (TIGR04551 family)